MGDGQNSDALDLVQRDFVGSAIMKLAGAWALMGRYLLRMFERAAIEQIGGDPGGAESMAIGGRAQGCLAASALDHTEHVMPAHPRRS
jgi:hypothetical protein